MRVVFVVGLGWALGACTGKAPVVGDVDTGDDSAEDTDGDSVAETGDSGGETGETGETGDDDTGFAEPCAAYGTPTAMGVVADVSLDELSGIAVSRRDPDVLWVHEDHGGDPEVYAISTAGELLTTITLAGATNNDWEDLSVGPCDAEGGSCVWIGEVGNNENDREGLGIYRFPEPDFSAVGDAEVEIEPTFFGFRYPDLNANSEAIAVTAVGVPVVLTKVFDPPISGVFTFANLDEAGEAELTWLGDIVTGEKGELGTAVTGADLWPDDNRLLVRTYAGLFELDTSAGLADISNAPSARLAGAVENQGEAASFDPKRGGFWQVAEGPNPTLWFTGCADAP